MGCKESDQSGLVRWSNVMILSWNINSQTPFQSVICFIETLYISLVLKGVIKIHCEAKKSSFVISHHPTHPNYYV